LSYGVGGFLFTILSMGSIGFIWAWTPLAAFFLWRWRHRGDLRWLAAAAIPLGLQVLIGEPVSLLQNWILIGVCAVADVVTTQGDRRRRAFVDAGALAVLATLAIALGAAQLLPGANHLRDTSRRGGLPYRVVTGFSSTAERPIEFLYPHYFGSHLDVGPYYWGASKFHGAPFLLSIYLGLLIAIAVIAAPFARPREAIPILVFSAIAYVAALGDHTPFFDILYDLGIASSFRFPEKFLQLVIVPLIWLATRTIDRFINDDPRTRVAVLASATALAATTMALMLWSRSAVYRQWFVDHWSLAERPETQPLVDLSRHYWVVAAGLTVVAALLLWSRRRWHPRIWAAAVIAFCVGDLSQVHAELAPRMPNSFFHPPGIIAALHKPLSDYGVFHTGEWLLEYFHPKYSQSGYRLYWTFRNGLATPTLASWGVRSAIDRDYDETYLAPTRELITAMLSLNLKGVAAWWQPFAAFSNVGYALEYRDYDVVATECRGQFEFSRPVTLRRFAAFAPRYYIAQELIFARNGAEVAQIARVRGVVPRVAYVPIRPFPPAPGRVLRADESPSRARIEVEAAGTSYLVMTVTRNRYWRVELDGQRVEPVATNIAFQGVVVPPGRHVVTMRYWNPIVLAGLSISGLALAVIIAAIVFGDRWKFKT
jgi:hypothetical protein